MSGSVVSVGVLFGQAAQRKAEEEARREAEADARAKAEAEVQAEVQARDSRFGPQVLIVQP